MQGQLEVMKGIISSFLQDSKDGKKKLLEWFLNNVMEEEARIQVSSHPYERSEERKRNKFSFHQQGSLFNHIFQKIIP